MVAQDTRRRLSSVLIGQDVESLNGFKAITNYKAPRPEAAAEVLETAYQTMLSKQSEETVKSTAAKAAADSARHAEWEFHNSILTMKETVKGQYGSDSDEAQAIGFKKKSERKRPSSRKATPAPAP
ncbi:hypothetical protein [Candidatus Cyanaurora vandensis]|uniref:hypothetical protein n=1 Tax=Candidatus Cyanaurora vandensis TaxID=2714958 RepID=UPI00257F7378|nr:hypothetical protein [Candidatus Cyanaurora vandensis]